MCLRSWGLSSTQGRSEYGQPNNQTGAEGEALDLCFSSKGEMNLQGVMMAALQQQVATIEATDERDKGLYDALSELDWLQQLSDIKCQQIEAQDRRNWMLSLRDHVNRAPYPLADYRLMLDLAVRLCD